MCTEYVQEAMEVKDFRGQEIQVIGSHELADVGVRN